MDLQPQNERNAAGSTPLEVFISYAHEDEGLLQQLETHLSLLKRQGVISTWHNRQIVAGTNWAQAINTQLEEAAVILLLISADFLASDYCYGIEMQRALQRHQAGEARVIPIVLRPVDWKEALFAHLQVLPTNAKAITTWNNRDEAFADVVAGLRLAIAEAPEQRTSLPCANLPPMWNVPYPRNALFTGREDLLTQLATSLRTGQPMALSQPPKDVQPQAISGLGGIGKTQVALEYVYQHRQDYQAVLWAQAETREALTTSYLTFAALLNLPEKDAQESAQVIAAVKQWLQRTSWYLLILDNADDLMLAREFLPPSMGGHVLLTTRAQAMGRFAKRLEVETLPVEQGTLFLLRRAGVLVADTLLEQASEMDRKVAREICEELGGLPLALDQAGAYIEETQSSLWDYRTLYRMQRAALLHERGGVVEDHPLPVATTWQISFERVEQQNPAAAEILRLCAFVAPDAIPEAILTTEGEQLGPLLHGLAGDPLALNKAIGVLRAYSLVRRDATAHMLSMHRLVQAVLKDAMSEAVQQEWAQRTISAVNAALPSVEHASWPQWEGMLAHALVCSELIEQHHLSLSEAALLLNQTGMYLYYRARYQEAGPLCQRALAIYEQRLGAEHPETANSLNNLAALYRSQGRYEQAEPLFKRVLAIREEQLGAIHPDTAGSLNNLALLYQEQGKYAEAEPLYQRALAIYKQQLGAIHPNAAASLDNLALLYRSQGKYEQAEPLCQQALAIYEQELGAMHPDTATSLNNLAELYRAQGKYGEAEPLYKCSLQIREQELGAMHPDTANSLNNLANLYYQQGKYGEAELLYRRALTIREEQLGAVHPDTGTSLNDLANLYGSQGRYSEAEPLYQRALAIKEEQLGVAHPDTANSLNNLATLYYRQDKYGEAELLYQRALAIYEQRLEIMHPDIATCLNNLATLYWGQSKYAEAELLLKRTLAIREQQLGVEHPDIARILNNLAELYQAQGEYAEAEPFYKRALAINEQWLGADHPSTQVVRGNYATLLRKLGRVQGPTLLLRFQQQRNEG